VDLYQTFLRKNNVTTFGCPTLALQLDVRVDHLNGCTIATVMRSLWGWIMSFRQEPQSCCLLFTTIKQSPLRFSTHAPTKN